MRVLEKWGLVEIYRVEQPKPKENWKMAKSLKSALKAYMELRAECDKKWIAYSELRIKCGEMWKAYCEMPMPKDKKIKAKTRKPPVEKV